MSGMSRGKRTILLASALVFLFSMRFPALSRASQSFSVESAVFAGEPSGNESYDIIMLMDKSGSMNFTDPRHNAVNAGKMFVDSLFTGVENKKAVGEDISITVRVVPFSRDPDDSAPLTVLKTEADAATVTDSIEAIQYDQVNTGATDLGKAVSCAVSHLDKRTDKTPSGLIVLFTDGYTDYLSSEPDAEQLEADSAVLLDDALGRAKKAGYVIYTIGLNHIDPATGRERIEPEGRAEIMKISDTTQRGMGLVHSSENKNGNNYLITDSFKAIQDYYIDLFASMMGSVQPILIQPSGTEPVSADPAQADGPQRLIFEIPMETQGISSANFYITSEQSAGTMQLWDPAGNPVPPNDARVSVKTDSENKYVIASLWKPEAGVWRLGVESAGPDLSVKTVPISGVSLQIDTTPVDDGQSVIQVRALDGGVEQTEAFYRSLTAAVCEAAADGSTPSSFPLNYNQGTNLLEAAVPVSDPGNYSIRAVIRSDMLVKQGFTAAEWKPEIVPLELTMEQGEEIEADLNEAIKGWGSGIELIGKQVDLDDEKAADAEVGGSTLTVKAKSMFAKDASFTVQAADKTRGTLYTIPVNVRITSNPFYLLRQFWWVPALILLLLLILLVAVLLRKRRRPVPPLQNFDRTISIDTTRTVNTGVNLRKDPSQSGVNLRKGRF